jgi:hypothetical protein
MQSDLQHSAGSRGENTKRHLQLGDGFIQVGMFVELLPQSTQNAVRLGDMLGRWVVLSCGGVFFGRLGTHGFT